MKYFILYITNQMDFTSECYVKGKSMDYMCDRIGRNIDSELVTSKEHIFTQNLKSGFFIQFCSRLISANSPTSKPTKRLIKYAIRRSVNRFIPLRG